MRDPYMGGQATHSNVSAFCGFYSCGENSVRVVEGVGSLVLAEMEKLGPGTIEHVISATGNHNINFEPEYLKCAMDNLLEEAGVTCFLHSYMTGAQVSGRNIESVTCSDDEGTYTITAKAYVDASGDANLARLAGARVTWGSGGGQVQAATLPFRLSGVDTTKDMSPAAVERAVVAAACRARDDAADIDNIRTELTRQGALV